MDSRKADLQELRNAYNSAKTPKERAMASHAASRIAGESKRIRSMREALIRERRKGNTENVRDINEWVSRHKEYQNER